MKKVFALMMASVIALSTPMAEVHAESNGEGNLEDELIITDDTFQSGELGEDDLDQEDADDMLAVSLWVGTQHNDIVTSVMQYYASDKRKSTIESCLRFGAVRADDAPLHSDKLNQLHGIHNYVLHLNALWLYSRKIGASNQTDKNCRIQVLNEIVIKDPNDRPNLETLLNTIPEIYKLYNSNVGHQPSNFEKKYLVLGLALHLIGDTYAHRTLVTIEGVDKAISDGAMKKSDFVSTKKYKEFRNAVKEGKVRCSKIDGNGWLKNDSVNPYEDSLNFMPKRFTYSKKTAKTFISNYVNNAAFSASYIHNGADGINLQKYDQYR